MDLQEKINKYHEKYPNYSKLILNRNCIEGIWVMGNNYTTRTNFYGAYPYGYLDRILTLADPPYSIEDCDHYGCCMVKRNIVLKECYKVLEKGGILIWLDQVLPNYKKIEFDIIGRIGMVKSTNHRFRVITIFRKL